MGIYDGADRAIRVMNRQNLRAFNQLRLADLDELNVVRLVGETYDASVRMAKRHYYEIAVDAYITALLEAGIDNRTATKMADDNIDNDWILDMLEEADPVTLYAFNTEVGRKKQRLIEALTAAQDKNREIDKALRYWTLQVSQYADNMVYFARLRAFEDAGIEYVRWVTQKDERVCHDCDDLDEEIFPIAEVPPPQHMRCRCRIVPVREDEE